MQKVKIPQKVDPKHAASKRLDYEGIVPKDKLSRLAELVEVKNDVEVNLSFDVDLQGITVLKGRVGTAVKCVCQHCGEDYEFDIESDFIYTSEVAKVEKLGIEDSYDFIDVDEFGEVDLFNMIEDELILALPMILMHEECKDSEYGSQVFQVGEIEEKANPFAVLSKLKNS